MMRGEVVEAAAEGALPVVVQVGFAGARRLFDAAVATSLPTHALEAAAAEVERRLRETLRELPHQLALGSQHRLVGVSALAVGGDLLFSRASAELGWQQRILLPQPRDAFLDAEGSRGPDFDPGERAAALAAFASPHVIEEAVVSHAPERTRRFEETALQIVAESDLLVCLQREDGDARAGGTRYLAHRALARGKPVLELTVGLDAKGQVSWHSSWMQRERFVVPTLPKFLGAIAAASTDAAPAGDFVDRLKTHASARSQVHSGWFKRAAFVIVGTHVFATLCAVLALKSHGTSLAWVLLIVELMLIACGMLFHQWLHRTSATPSWAMARMCAEIARSAAALRGVDFPLRQLEAMPYPRELRTLMRTVSVLALRRQPEPTAAAGEALRQRYLEVRLGAPESGQLAYYGRQRDSASRWNRRATHFFTAFAGVAFLATASEVALSFLAPEAHLLLSWAGVLAIWLPVLAVGVMSLAAANDLEARAHTFAEMHAFLAAQARQIEATTSYREFATLAQETEIRLLGETLIWSARRSFASVA